MAKENRVRDDGKIESDRRGFLKLAGLGVVAGGASVVAGEASAADAAAQKTTGYRETEHVKTFYKTARF